MPEPEEPKEIVIYATNPLTLELLIFIIKEDQDVRELIPEPE